MNTKPRQRSSWRSPCLHWRPCSSARPRRWAQTAGKKQPNIVIIWGDDIGQSNVSAYSHGLMGFKTPNIDRVAKEGVMFTDYYAEQSCTAGRASFITGQCGLRTGNTKVGMPGAAQGLQARDVTIAQLLKAQGYATGQFGKNHLGDRNEYPAHRPRVRRVLRRALPPERLRRAGTARTTRRTRRSSPSSARAACSTARPRPPTTRRSIRASARSASRPSRTPAR